MAAHNGSDEPSQSPTTLLLDILQRVTVIETQNLSILSEQTEARDSRRLIHQKQDELARRLDGFDRLKEQLEETSLPQLAEHERLRQNFVGGVFVAGAIGSVVLVALGFILRETWGWISSHFTWRP